MSDHSVELTDRAAAAESIRKLNEDDLRFLNRLIVERLKLIHQARSTVMLANFSEGDRVSFPASDGLRRCGVIVRLNKKTASIVTDEGQRWKVHPSFLSAIASEQNQQPVKKHQGEIEWK
jgi:hypothetical protein